MSPIFIRPVREQLEHDRLIRQLVPKYKRKFDVVANLGDEQAAPVKLGTNTFFPDLVLTSGKKLAGLVEVETGESVNNLEAMAQWVHFSRARVPFHLYVPVQAYDAAKRLSDAHQARVAEIWTYRVAGDTFDLVRMFHDPAAAAAAARAAAPVAKPSPPAPAAKPAKKPAARPAARPAAKAKPRSAAKPSKPSKPAPRAGRAAAKRPAAKPGKAIARKR